jgi:hypothetical protein
MEPTLPEKLAEAIRAGWAQQRGLVDVVEEALAQHRDEIVEYLVDGLDVLEGEASLTKERK